MSSSALLRSRPFTRLSKCSFKLQTLLPIRDLARATANCFRNSLTSSGVKVTVPPRHSITIAPLSSTREIVGGVSRQQQRVTSGKTALPHRMPQRVEVANERNQPIPYDRSLLRGQVRALHVALLQALVLPAACRAEAGWPSQRHSGGFQPVSQWSSHLSILQMLRMRPWLYSVLPTLGWR